MILKQTVTSIGKDRTGDHGLNGWVKWYAFHFSGLIFFVFLPVIFTHIHAQDALREIPDPDPMLQKEMLHTADGLEVNLFASEPMVVKPIQMNWDADGRLWVVGSTTYPQPEPGVHPDDKVYVLEDTNGDGRADRSTVFADGLFMPTGVLPGDGGVYVANSTEILHLKDTTGDGKADQRRVVLSGFGTADSHHLIHTFRWGPDGRFYFNQAIYIFSHVETPHGVRRLEGGGVWQFRPETMELDVYARGLVNPWGLQFDRWGNSFLTDGAGSEGIHYGFPGAVFRATPGAERFLEGLNPGQPKHSGLEILSGRHLPESWDGSLVTNDYRANRINRFVLEEQGSGFISEQAEDLLWSNHVAFRPVDVTVGPDGAIYVADWYNPIIQHGEVDFRDERRDQQHGRIWRISVKDRPPVDPPKLKAAGTEELLEVLKLPEKWTRDQARRMLKERNTEEVIPALEDWVENLDEEHAEYEQHLMEALWVYQAKDMVRESVLVELLRAEDHNVRAAAVRVLNDWQGRVENAMELLREMVEDPHPRVRLEAVIALRRQHSAEAAVAALSALHMDMDEYLDFTLWQTVRELEPRWLPRLQEDRNLLADSRLEAYALKSVESPEAVRLLAEMYRQQEVPEEYHDDVLNSIARWGDVPELNMLFDLAVEGRPVHRNGKAAYLEALEEAARRQEKKPDRSLDDIAVFIESEDTGIAIHAIRLAGYWGLENLRENLTELAQQEEDELRTAALEALAAMGDDLSRRELIRMAAEGFPVDLRKESVLQIISFDADQAAKLAVDLLNDWESDTDPAELFSAFYSREEATRALSEQLSKNQIPEELARAGREAMRRHIPWYRQGDEISEQLAEALEASGGVLPPERMPQDLSPLQVNELEREVRTTADPVRGEKIYRQDRLMCMNCHAIGGAGGLVGPDLSGLGRSAPTDNIIYALIDPNRTIKEGYELTRVERTDGSVVMGTMVRETSSEVVLRDGADREVSIPANRIASRDIVPGSLMPPGLTASLEREEFVDLVGFLSQLGEPGEFRVPGAQLVRRWRVLNSDENAARRLREGGVEIVLSEETDLRWRNTYSKVSGALPVEELPLIEPDTDRQYHILRFEADVSEAGTVAVSFNSGNGIRVWIEERKIGAPVNGILETELDKGVHWFTLVVDRTEFGSDEIQIELLEERSSARVRPVSGK